MLIVDILKKIFSDHQNHSESDNGFFDSPTSTSGIFVSIKKLWPFIQPNLRKGILAAVTLLSASLLALPIKKKGENDENIQIKNNR